MDITKLASIVDFPYKYKSRKAIGIYILEQLPFLVWYITIPNNSSRRHNKSVLVTNKSIVKRLMDLGKDKNDDVMTKQY